MVHGPWGCECPDQFLGVELNSHGGDAWVAPIFADGVEAPRPWVAHPDNQDGEVQSSVSVVEGWFMGDMETMMSSYDKSAVVARMARFKVAPARAAKNGDGMPVIVGGPLPPFRLTKTKKPR